VLSGSGCGSLIGSLLQLEARSIVAAKTITKLKKVFIADIV
jgi:hypothetical protein